MPESFAIPGVEIPFTPLIKNKKLRKETFVSTVRVSVVIVNYRQWKWTEQLVRRLSRCAAVRQGRAEILIIDNNSPHHPAIRKLQSKEFVTLRRWRRNRGFSCAVNEGCKYSSGDWILILNPDITPAPRFLDQIEELLDQPGRISAKTGIIGFGLRNPDGSFQGSTGPLPTFWGTMLRRVLPRAWRKYDLHNNSEARKVDWLTGCCMLVRRECIRDLKRFDQDFFLYYEDVDFCKRATDAGWDVLHDPSLFVIHHEPLHTRRVPPRLRVITRQALMTYAAKHWRGSEARWMCRLIRIEAKIRLAVARIQGDGRSAKWYDRLARYAALMCNGSLRVARGEFLAALAEPVH